MRILAIWYTLVTSSLALVAAVPFGEQVQRADAVARIVVVQIAKLDFTDQEEWTFTGMAKCRVVTDYTGKLKNADFVYIPCDYTFDESPSPLEVGKDYIICLDLLNHGGIAHPVSHDAAHEISHGMLEDAQSGKADARVSLKDFETRLRVELKKKAEQGGADQPATAPLSKPSDDSTPNPESRPRP